MPDSYGAREQFEARYVRPVAGRTLICGSRLYEGREDRRALFANAIGVDMLAGPGVDLVHNLEDDCSDLGRFGHIECLSVLEHSARPWLLAANLEQLLKRNGTLYVSAPFAWRVHAYPSDYWRFTQEAVQVLFPRIRWERLMYASSKLKPDHYIKGVDIGGHPHLPRTEVVGFGVRK